ncbi:Alpha/Beta hydrolase protein [Roridomyces roridus]|uniref:Alpha/Beta hydrolase protein n=1 Tax=Roridomyces roridus TaxID=1738132 RepID=A0AAD7FB63_9AGAR|nr:Alpha/Beta hydrolase protein [Roridomyces roridus]
MSVESPFIISIPQESLSLLQQKLRLVTFPDELDDAGWEYGAPLTDIRRLVTRWSNGYDWRYHEAQLNMELPQFTRDIDVGGHGMLNVHYVHKKSDAEYAIPLLFVHGWPGSFFEARKLVPLLTRGSPDHPSFHVVAISLPGFGFSEAPRKKGFNLDQYAEVCNKLMLSLGYNEYVTQGGDWGFIITRRMAHLYGPKYVKAWHTNFPGGTPPSLLTQPLSFLTVLFHFLFPSLNPQMQAGFDKTQKFIQSGSGYNAIQGTKPQTLGYSMADSPVGLLAWIYEKLVGWTDGYAWDDDEVLTWISIYWFSRAGPTAAARIYYEVGGGNALNLGKLMGTPEYTASIPHGISRFPGEVAILPKSWAKSNRKIVFDREHERGGHFAAYERPVDVCGDLREMFGRGGPAFGVVKGRDGYNSE